MEWFNNYWWAVLAAVLATPFASVVAFAVWLKRKPSLTVEEKVKCWDVFVKLVSALTVVVSGAILIGKYFDQRKDSDDKASAIQKAEFLRQRLSFDTERYERQKVLFSEAKLIAARFVQAQPPADADIRRFTELYFADLIGVEERNGAVSRAMVAIHDEVAKRDSSGANFQELSLALSNACKSELESAQDALLAQQRAIADVLSPAQAP